MLCQPDPQQCQMAPCAQCLGLPSPVLSLGKNSSYFFLFLWRNGSSQVIKEANDRVDFRLPALSSPCAGQPEQNAPPSSWPYPSGHRARSVPCDCLGFDCLGHETGKGLLSFPLSFRVSDDAWLTPPVVQTLEVPLRALFCVNSPVWQGFEVCWVGWWRLKRTRGYWSKFLPRN